MTSPLFAELDVLVAAVACAFLLPFSTPKLARDAARRMSEFHALAGTGFLLVSGGALALVASLVETSMDAEPPAMLARMISYPLLLFGFLLVAASTWRDPREVEP